MKRIFIIAIITLVIMSCSNEEIQFDRLQGKWNECYEGTDFVMDGRVEYEFAKANAYVETSYDALSGKVSVKKGYYAVGLVEDNVLTLNPQMSDFSNVSYTIVKLSAQEMVWQRVGTSLSKSSHSYGSDYRRFKRIK